MSKWIDGVRGRLGRFARSESARALALFCAIVAGLATIKIPFTEHAFGPLPDGGYYQNIAQHVRDGHGLITDLSLAYKGAPDLPYPTDMYPLWPLVYGYAARFLPLEATGHWLPATLYFVALAFAYLWARGLYAQQLFPRALPNFNAGHLLVVMLGLDSEFFRYTSYPYTEGLTYCLVFAGLWRANSLLRRPSLLRGLELGVWIGLATLSRKQQFILALAAGAVLGAAVVFTEAEHRKPIAKHGLGTLLGFVAVCAPHYWYMSTIFPRMKPAQFLRWDQNQHTRVLPPLPTLRAVKGLWPYLKDRAAGIPVAFGKSKWSYTNQYYTFQYAPFAAFPLALRLAWERRGEPLVPRWRALWDPEGLPRTYAAVVALAGFFSIHTMHMHTEGSAEWMFAARHAITSIYLFFFALVFVLAADRAPWKAIGVFILASSCYLGVVRVHDWSEAVENGVPIPEPALAKWLDAEKARRGKLIVAARQPQVLAEFTPGVGYHWFHDKTTYADICAMTTKLGVDYVIAGPRPIPPFTRDKAYLAAFDDVETIGGWHVWAPKPTGPCMPPPQ